MPLADWLSLVLICSLGAMSPGPSLAVVSRNALRGGRRQGVITAMAHGFGVGLYALLTVTGLALIIKQSPSLFHGIQWIGALFLIYIGVRLLLKKSETEQPNKDTPPQSQKAFTSGFLIAFLNPKLAIFFLALFSQFVSADASWTIKAMMVFIAGGIDTLWYLFVACLFSHPGLIDTLKQKATLLDKIFGVILLLLAARLLLSL